MIKYLIKTHKDFWNKKNITTTLSGSLLLILALLVQKIVDNYLKTRWWTVVWDSLLDKIPSIDIDQFIILSVIIVNLFVLFLLIFKPKYLSFTLKSIAIFIIIRAFFISLTHLWIQPEQIVFNTNAIWYNLYDLFFNTTNDFFFSAHTWLPFLIALIFFKEKILRNTFFLISVIFWSSVLIWHMHYSIDVFASPFMTYWIYNIAKNIFNKDYKLSIS